MVEANDVEIILTQSMYKKDDGSLKERLHGYELYKGNPVGAVGGWRISPDKTYKYTRLSLNFSGSEEARKNPIEDEVAFIKDVEYDSGTKYGLIKHKVGEDWFNGFKPHLFDMVIPMGGWVSKETFINKFGDPCHVIRLKFDEYRYTNTKNKEAFKLVDLKNSLSDDDLALMKEKQFAYFDDYMKLIKEFEANVQAKK